jgi:hypothetical protein
VTDLTDALAQHNEGIAGPHQYSELAAAARRVAEAPEVLYCTNHYQLGNELWCTHGRIWDKPCQMVRKLLVDPA